MSSSTPPCSLTFDPRCPNRGPKAEGRSSEVMSALARTAHIVRRDRQVGKVRLPEGPPCRARRKPGISTLRIERLGLVICPSGGLLTGLSSLYFGFSEKYLFPLTQIKARTLTIAPHRGAYRDRHGRGEGCGGRGSFLRAMGWQGELKDL